MDDAVPGKCHVLLGDLDHGDPVPLLAAAQRRHHEPRIPVLHNLGLGLRGLTNVVLDVLSIENKQLG